MPVSCFLHFGKKKVTSKQENLDWIGQLSFYGGKASFTGSPPTSQNDELELAGAMSNAGSPHISLLF